MPVESWSNGCRPAGRLAMSPSRWTCRGRRRTSGGGAGGRRRRRPVRIGRVGRIVSARRRPRASSGGSSGCAATRKLGPARIAGIVEMPASTVHRVLCRQGLNRLAWMDRPTGRVIRRIETTGPASSSTSTSRSWVGSQPVAAGGPMVAARRPQRDRAASRYDYIHSVIDAYSRVAYSRDPAPTRPPSTCIGVSRACRDWFAAHGVTIERVLTDNGPGYRSHDWRDLLRRARHRAPPDPALHAAHQRQGRTVQPHPARRMGLRPRLPLKQPPARRTCTAGSTPTTITAATPPSEANHPSPASTTCQGTYT